MSCIQYERAEFIKQIWTKFWKSLNNLWNISLMLMNQFVLTSYVKINRWRDQMLMSWNSTLIVSWIMTTDWLQLKLILCDDSCSYSLCVSEPDECLLRQRAAAFTSQSDWISLFHTLLCLHLQIWQQQLCFTNIA